MYPQIIYGPKASSFLHTSGCARCFSSNSVYEMPWFLAILLIIHHYLSTSHPNLGRLRGQPSLPSLGCAPYPALTLPGDRANRSTGWPPASSPSYSLNTLLLWDSLSFLLWNQNPLPMPVIPPQYSLGFARPGADWGEPDPRHTYATHSPGDGSSPSALQDRWGNSFLSSL